MEKTKVMTLVGFGLRARKVVCGTNAIAFSKRVKLMFLCHTASPNSRKEAEKMARRFGVPLVLSKNLTLEEFTYKPNCKMFAILDEQFAQAILTNLDDGLEIIFRGGNSNERD